jgi:tetratricopeptide (TPR) repeat protein
VRHHILLAALGCALMILGGAARAQDSGKGKDATLEEARRHAAQAKVHYDLGEFEKAAEEYTEVYRLRPLPALLFNIAQSYRQAGQYEKARQFYRAYLRENPEGETSVAVKRALKEIDELLAKEKKTKDAPPAGVQPPPAEMAGRGQPGAQAPVTPPAAAPAPAPQATKPAAGSPTTPQAVPAGPAVAQTKPAPTSALPAATVTTMHEGGPSSTRRILTYSLAGASVAMLAGGAIFAIKAKNVDNELQANPHTTASADDLMSQSKSAHTLSLLLLGAGVASAAGAAVLYFLPTPSGAAVAGRL